MRLAVATLSTGTAELLEAHVGYHLAAGADLVLVAGAGLDDAQRAVLERHVTGGSTRVVDAATHTDLARAAVGEADWLVPATSNEFWWPRGESLAEVLSVVPERYAVVQALVRRFVAGEQDEGEGPATERLTLRSSLLGSARPDGVPSAELLRPAYRVVEGLVIDPSDRTMRGRLVPLRAWYPLEVLCFPSSGSSIESSSALVEDTRLRDALRRLAESPGRPLALPVPTIVDDASYAIECAAVGEVDLDGLDRQIRALELRIAALEARPWARAQRAARRLRETVLRRRRS